MKYCTVCKAKYEDSVSFCPVDGEVLEDDPSSIVGTVLDGQYQIEALLGKGGMGAVYRARHILLGDRVAIKIMPPEVRSNAEWLRRFRREGQAARRFRHPNAVTVYDLRTAADGTIYMVMEYVEGNTLDAEIKRRGRFSPADAFAVLEPIMSVLNTAHSMGVVHRDLKPENIMIGKSGNADEKIVKLLDLGIAKMREIAGSDNGGTTALTMAGQVLGTPYYMSPEQWGEIPRDGSSEIDGRADIYSLGLVFYEMISGRRTCSGATLSELRREHVSVTPKPLGELVPGVSPAFSLAIARATAKDRDDRQASAGELAAELKAAVEGGVAPGFEKTLPDIPRPDSPSAATAGIPSASHTASDVNAPTLITLDSPPTSGSLQPNTHGAQPAVPKVATDDYYPGPAPSSGANSSPTVVEAATSSVTLPHAGANASVAPPLVTPREERAPSKPSGKGKSIVFAGVGLLIIGVVVLGVGGFLGYRWYSNQPAGSATNTTPVEPAATAKSLGDYWLELYQEPPAKHLRVAGMVPLASGQAFRFHFRFSQDGYLYIIGSGMENKPTAFLTAKPAPALGITSNRVTSSDFSFPAGEEAWLELDKKPGTETYTVIFSPTQLTSPGFLQKEPTGEPLSETERSELRSFVEKHSEPRAQTELNSKSTSEPFVEVKVPPAADNPIVFQIRIEHK